MRCCITTLNGVNRERVKDVLVNHPEWYGEYDDLTTLHSHFYEVDVNGEMIAFFSLAYWNNEVVLCCVYVQEDYRRRGVLKCIVAYAKKKTPRNYWLTINSQDSNVLATQIYASMFDYFYFDADDKVHWFVIKEPRRHKKKRRD